MKSTSSMGMLLLRGTLVSVGDVRHSDKGKNVLFEVSIDSEARPIKVSAFQSNSQNYKMPPFVDMLLNAKSGSKIFCICKPSSYKGFINWSIDKTLDVETTSHPKDDTLTNEEQGDFLNSQADDTPF